MKEVDMQLDWAIQHCIDVADRIEKDGCYEVPNDLFKCAAEHRQLAEWLKELKERRTKDEQHKMHQQW